MLIDITITKTCAFSAIVQYTVDLYVSRSDIVVIHPSIYYHSSL